ncbi:MAG: hypothetical protein V1870_03155 [Candidatus Aenigmatarchaeota archaeon]
MMPKAKNQSREPALSNFNPIYSMYSMWHNFLEYYDATAMLREYRFSGMSEIL